jgi:hypothetical protein
LKKLLAAFLIFAGLGSLRAEEVRIADLSAGMWTNYPANKIPDNAAAYLENVFTDSGGVLEQRHGFNIAVADCSPSLPTSSSSTTVQGLFVYTAPDQSEYFIAISSGKASFSYRSSASSCSNSTISTTTYNPVISSTVVFRGANNLGKLFVTNDRLTPGYFTATTTVGNLTFTSVSSMPKGKLISSWRNRIAVAASTDAVSSIYFSGDGDGTAWTVGGNPTDPFIIQIGGASDGKDIKCMHTYGDDLIIGKYNELWKISGFDQLDVTVRKISSDYGCVEQGSIQEKEGTLIFLSNLGIAQLSGEGVQVISEPVRNIVEDVLFNNVFSTAPTPMASAVYQGRYWLAYSSIAWSAGFNYYNRNALVLQRNRSWTLMSNVNVASHMLVWKDHYLYLGRIVLPQGGPGTGATNAQAWTQVQLYNPLQFVSSPDLDNYTNGNLSVTMFIITKRYDFGFPMRYKEPRDFWISSDGDIDWDDSDPYWTPSVAYNGTRSFTSLGNSTTLSATQSYVSKFPFSLSGVASPFYDVQFKIVKNRTLNFGEAPRLSDLLLRYNVKDLQ